jgi:hypothetical protein
MKPLFNGDFEEKQKIIKKKIFFQIINFWKKIKTAFKKIKIILKNREPSNQFTPFFSRKKLLEATRGKAE